MRLTLAILAPLTLAALVGCSAPKTQGTFEVPPGSYAQAFDATYPRLVERFDTAFVPFLLEDVAARPELNQADGIHPTAEGHALIAERVWSALQPVLASASEAGRPAASAD